jgi:hypothetical protein
MALPVHLTRFDSLLDLVADVIAREIEEADPETTKAAPARAAFRSRKDLQREHHTAVGECAAISK